MDKLRVTIVDGEDTVLNIITVLVRPGDTPAQTANAVEEYIENRFEVEV